MSEYFREESDIDWNCQVCKGKKGTKKTTLVSPPPVLLVQLRRYKYDTHRQQNSKLSTIVNIVDQFELLGSNYCLVSAILHQGPSVNSGHYTAYARCESGWCFYNDEKVTSDIPLDKVLSDASSNGYILIFKKFTANGITLINDPLPGFLNPSVFCYANASFQALGHVGVLQHICTSHAASNKCKPSCNCAKCLTLKIIRSYPQDQQPVTQSKAEYAPMTIVELPPQRIKRKHLKRKRRKAIQMTQSRLMLMEEECRVNVCRFK
jgi:uncharacterized UBP type Zn finger protein